MRIGVGGAWRWGVLALVVVSADGSTARGTTLRWRFQAGESLHYEIEQKAVQTAKLPNGQEQKTKVSQTIDMRWAIKAVGPDGVADVALTIDRVRSRLEQGPVTFAFDSNDKNQGNDPLTGGLVSLLRSVIGVPFTFKVNPQGEIRDVKVPEGVVKAIKEAGGDQAQGGGGLFSEDGLKNLITESSLALPKDDLAKGTTWTRETKVATPPLGTMKRTNTYTYQGPDARAERIDMAAKLELEPSPAGGITIKLTSQDVKGAFFFDNAAGRLANSSATETIETVATIGDAKITNRSEMTTTTKLVTDAPK